MRNVKLGAAVSPDVAVNLPERLQIAGYSEFTESQEIEDDVHILLEYKAGESYGQVLCHSSDASLTFIH